MPDDADFGDDLTFTHLTGRPAGRGHLDRRPGRRPRVRGPGLPRPRREPRLGRSATAGSQALGPRTADKAVVFNWDRGSDVPAVDADAAKVVDFLTAGLAEHAFGS